MKIKATNHVHSLLASASIFGLAISGSVRAQSATTAAIEPSPVKIEEVVVTAEKRSTNLQRTPSAVTALSGSKIKDLQVRDLKDLRSIVPNFQMGDSGGVSQISIRGIGATAFFPGGEGAIAVNQNEVYIASSVGQQTGLFDIGDVEVLRGPQGTLYGRNATGGAVNITTARPKKNLDGYASATVGNYGEVRVEGAVGGPVDHDGKLLVRLAGFDEHHNGYGQNVATHNGIDDKDARGLRGTIVYSPVHNFSATLIGEYYQENDRQGGYHYFSAGGLNGLSGSLALPPLFIEQGGHPPANVRDVANGLDPSFYLKTYSATSILQWYSGPFTVRSITGYRTQSSSFAYDIDGGTPLNLVYRGGEPAHQVSEELQLRYDSGRLHATGGLYYINAHETAAGQVLVTDSFVKSVFSINAFPTGLYTYLNTPANLKTEAEAVFGQATYDFTPELSFTAGIRYSRESKSIDAVFGVDNGTGGLPFLPPYPGPNPLPTGFTASKTFSSVTPKLGIQYQACPNILVYASYSQGFKSGGFDTGVPTAHSFNPEKITDYEAGAKTTLFDGRLRLNLAGFYYDYTNLQVSQIEGFNVVTSNAATASDYGVEAELTYKPTASIQVDASGAWTHARYDKYLGTDPQRPLLAAVDFSGHALDNAPEYQATIGVQYTRPLPTGEVIARAEVEYTDRTFFGPGNEDNISQGAFAKVNLFVTWVVNRDWKMTAFIKNVGDVTTKTSAEVSSSALNNEIAGSLAPPRLTGLEVMRKF